MEKNDFHSYWVKMKTQDQITDVTTHQGKRWIGSTLFRRLQGTGGLV